MHQITDAQKQQFKEEGYFILENAIPAHHLDLLRGECQAFIDKANARMDAEGTDSLGLNHRNSRYFVSNCFRDQPRLREFLFSPLIGRHLPSHFGRRRLLVLGAIRSQGCRGRHEVLLASRLGLRRLPGSQAVSNLLVRPRRHVRGQWHRPLAAVFALGHSHVGQARPRGGEQRFDRLLRQRSRRLGRRPGRQHCRLHQRTIFTPAAPTPPTKCAACTWPSTPASR